MHLNTTTTTTPPTTTATITTATTTTTTPCNNNNNNNNNNNINAGVGVCGNSVSNNTNNSSTANANNSNKSTRQSTIGISSLSDTFVRNSIAKVPPMPQKNMINNNNNSLHTAVSGSGTGVINASPTADNRSLSTTIHPYAMEILRQFSATNHTTTTTATATTTNDHNNLWNESLSNNKISHSSPRNFHDSIIGTPAGLLLSEHDINAISDYNFRNQLRGPNYSNEESLTPSLIHYMQFLNSHASPLHQMSPPAMPSRIPPTPPPWWLQAANLRTQGFLPPPPLPQPSSTLIPKPLPIAPTPTPTPTPHPHHNIQPNSSSSAEQALIFYHLLSQLQSSTNDSSLVNHDNNLTGFSQSMQQNMWQFMLAMHQQQESLKRQQLHEEEQQRAAYMMALALQAAEQKQMSLRMPEKNPFLAAALAHMTSSSSSSSSNNTNKSSTTTPAGSTGTTTIVNSNNHNHNNAFGNLHTWQIPSLNNFGMNSSNLNARGSNSSSALSGNCGSTCSSLPLINNNPSTNVSTNHKLLFHNKAPRTTSGTRSLQTIPQHKSSGQPQLLSSSIMPTRSFETLPFVKSRECLYSVDDCNTVANAIEHAKHAWLTDNSTSTVIDLSQEDKSSVVNVDEHFRRSLLESTNENRNNKMKKCDVEAEVIRKRFKSPANVHNNANHQHGVDGPEKKKLCSSTSLND